MDTDIAAADALQLERIAAQDYRNECANLAAHRSAVQAHLAAIRAQYAAYIEWVKAEYAALPDPEAEKRLELAKAIAEKYFTTGTATLPESVLLDAVNDARRFRAALDEAVKAV